MAAATSSRSCTRRIEELSRSKPLPPGFAADRRSVYWIDRYPYTPGSEGTTAFDLTPRQDFLCNPKKPHPLHKGDRPSPLWPVTNAARGASASGHLEILALAKSVPFGYQHERSVYTYISRGARNASATERLAHLSMPKAHKIWANSNDTYHEGEFGTPINNIPHSALGGNCSTRVEVLAEAKNTHPSYIAERTVQWPVSDQAKNSIATLRLQQLARPKSGRLAKDDYDPYRVSAAARGTRASPRVGELSMPLARKCRQKKATT